MYTNTLSTLSYPQCNKGWILSKCSSILKVFKAWYFTTDDGKLFNVVTIVLKKCFF